jgi:GT2 family glycosyltransferase
MSKSKIKVSIILLHYQKLKLLRESIDSILNNKPNCNFEIIVVDNDEKETIKKTITSVYPHVKYIRSKGNIGYGSGNNLGARHSQGEYLLILNPDTEINRGSIDYLTNHLDACKNTAIVAPLLVDINFVSYDVQESKELNPITGLFVLSFLNKLFPNNKFSRNYYLVATSKKKAFEVAAAPGSAFMIRKKVFDQVGGFDENIFLYFEESDIGKRVKTLGYKIFMIPEALIVHKCLHKGIKNKKLQQIFNKSRFYYFRKHYGLFPALIVDLFARFSKLHALFIVFALVLVLFVMLYL